MTAQEAGGVRDAQSAQTGVVRAVWTEGVGQLSLEDSFSNVISLPSWNRFVHGPCQQTEPETRIPKPETRNPKPEP